MSVVPRFHRLSTWNLGWGLLCRDDAVVHAVTWGPISIMWDRGFKRGEARQLRRTA